MRFSIPPQTFLKCCTNVFRALIFWREWTENFFNAHSRANMSKLATKQSARAATQHWRSGLYLRDPPVVSRREDACFSFDGTGCGGVGS